MIKNFLTFMVPQFIIEKLIKIYKQANNFRALSLDYGQWLTIRDWNSVDERGDPTPWYTYPATEYLNHLDFSKLNVLEYGSGNSTLWWSKKVKKITSIEDDEGWFVKVKKSLHFFWGGLNTYSRPIKKIMLNLELLPMIYLLLMGNFEENVLNMPSKLVVQR